MIAINKIDFIKQLTEKNEKKITDLLQKKTIGIAGCGGLGSNVAAALTRIGIKKLILIDFDKVVLSNLNRQFFFIDDIGKDKVDALSENLLKINPYIEIEKHNLKLTEKNITECLLNSDIIVEAFDEAQEKSMIINAFLEKKEFSEKYLICASGLAGYDSSNIIQTIKFNERIFIAGDFTSQACEKGVMAPRVWIAASHQANMIVRIIAGIKNV
ncbi:MAG TPA: sulfur carrier protein ThiS adenylyltransferase ThiF [bacterium]|nr:sulfur carrier protein ThiS adenylyltransferase ThiF [bacterium]HPN30261.1 sulfur carrier protein ThiS adenylyltransferase ThiF [bacterium]